ncbi:3-hydroxyisobutyrate dehydrogenase [Saliniradius amylolyticus]|uniref:3-hydroxyisobutyrate dehydrogenase n=1 Tax=Saliniradius amylolyticus TaxID=2183582 RepID=A0A2S2E2U2_9ALTE|nr:NAD(P)-dependent oxidoreductase [Saliniradius amylolyticus]AWL11842.1 3-hydroxyisobutyrate dehydrogenase [Saliniradius amylolyticus]
MTKVAFIGLGVMGYPMAGHLAQAGFDVRVYNRTRSKADNWCDQFGGNSFKTPRQAAEDADVVLLCVGNDDDVRSVTIGEQGVLASMKEQSVLVDHTTASASLAEELADAANRVNVGFLDAPVSGGQAGAEQGQLTIMMGGDETSYQRVKPVLDSYAKHSQLLGPVGSGQLAKMMNQICIAGIVQGLSEALNFGQASGLDCEAVVEVIRHGAAQSWQMENRYKTMLQGEYDFGFAVDWMRKDLNIALQQAAQTGVSLPVTALVDQFYSDVQAMGGGRWDTSSLLARLNK